MSSEDVNANFFEWIHRLPCKESKDCNPTLEEIMDPYIVKLEDDDEQDTTSTPRTQDVLNLMISLNQVDNQFDPYTRDPTSEDWIKNQAHRSL
jgi:hypothetical protein